MRGYTNSQNRNRYSYVTNNPLRYTDPTGHSMDDGCRDYGCGSPAPTPTPPPIPLPPPDGGGTTGHHGGDGDDTPTIPPIVVVPPVENGPGGIIIIPLPGPDTSNFPEPEACVNLEREYHEILDQVLSLQEQIHELQETLKRTREPQHKKEVEQQIKRLNNQLGSLLVKHYQILARARVLGCSFAG